MKRFIPKYNVYVTPDGESTHNPEGGKNKLVVVKGAPLSEENANRLGIPELEAKRASGESPVTSPSETGEETAPIRESRTRGRFYTKEEWKDKVKAESAKAESAKSEAAKTEPKTEEVKA